MSYLAELVENAEESHGFTGRRAEHFEELKRQQREKTSTEDDKSGVSILASLVSFVAGFLLWYWWKRY